MNYVIAKKIDRILNSGMFIQEQQNWLFEEKEAYEKLNELIKNKYPILGGEISTKRSKEKALVNKTMMFYREQSIFTFANLF